MIAPCPLLDHVANGGWGRGIERIRISCFRTVYDKAFVPRFIPLDLRALVAHESSKGSLIYKN